jgi:hypothetical protein
MGKLILHDNPDPDALEQERAARYRDLPFADKLKELFALIDLAVKMNGGKPIKEPQGKGLVIRKPKP